MPHTILFLHLGGDRIRGSEEVLLTLIDGLDRSEMRPVVVASNAVLRAPLERFGTPVHVLELPELILAPGAEPGRLPEVRLPVARWARALAALRKIAGAEGARLVVANGGGPIQLGLPVARLRGVPLVAMLHHPGSRAHHWCWGTRHADGLVFFSEYTRAHARTKLGVSGELVPLGVDVGHFRPPAVREPAARSALGIDPDEVVFAQVGALVPHKGHTQLLTAFARVRASLPRVRLLVIGDGPEGPSLRTLAASLGVAPQVTFAGWVPEVAPYLQHVVDVNVLASSVEGFGLVNVQAAACGLPSISTDGTGTRETIVDGETGLLVPVGDVDALAAAMVALGGDPARRARMGAAGRRLAESRFSSASFQDGMRRVLRGWLPGRKAPAVGAVRAPSPTRSG